MVNFVTAVAYHFCLISPAAFSQPGKHSFDDPCKNLETFTQLFNLFMLLWGLFFLSALEELVMAGAFSAWYWTFNKKDDLPAAPLSLSAWRAFRYHLGTLGTILK